MLSYSQSLSLYQKLTENAEAANTSLFNIIFNEKLRTFLNKANWPFLEKRTTISTVAAQQFYDLPHNSKKVMNVSVTVGSTTYSPIRVTDSDTWDRLNQSTLSSTIPQYFYIFGQQLGLWPTPSTSGNTIALRYKVRQKDLTIADYVTGLITTTVVGDETIVGSSTAWTDKMDNERWFRITDDNADNTGDGEWYEVDSITDTVNLELLAPYAGAAITGGTAEYVLAQVSLIPEGYQLIPVYRAVADYWLKEDFAKSQAYDAKADQLVQEAIDFYNQKSEDPTLLDSELPQDNPNLFIEL